MTSAKRAGEFAAMATRRVARPRYGSSFFDEASGIRVALHHPQARPDLWEAYVAGARREYARWGIPELVDSAAMSEGAGVSVFVVGLDTHGEVVMGMRCYGPLESVDELRALKEMRESSELETLRQRLEASLAGGILETKGMWRRGSGGGGKQIGLLLHSMLHARDLLDCEVVVGAAADRLREGLCHYGAEVLGEESVPFPSEDHRTLLYGVYRGREPMSASLRAHFERQAEALGQRPQPTTVGWRPVILDPTGPRAERQVLAVLADDPDIVAIDSYDRQRRELEGLATGCPEDARNEGDRYVWYPWRSALVRLLGPRAFEVVRLDRNRNRITRDEQRRLRCQRVGVVGLSVGHSVALTLALEGLCGELHLADFDQLELTNLNRVPASVLDIGVNKAVAAARRIAEIDPYAGVICYPEGLRIDNVRDFVAGLDVVVEECDDIAMKVAVREAARAEGIPVVMETSDRGMLDVERFDETPGQPIFFGLLGDVRAEALAEMGTEAKVPLVAALVGVDEASARGVASLSEVGQSLSTWPQLGTDVTLGGASAATAVRRIGLGEALASGRARVDLEQAITRSVVPRAPSHAPIAPPAMAPPPADPLLAVAHAATLAPSGGNAQPWRLILTGETLAFLPHAAGSAALDIRGRASVAAIGAAVFNAQVAAEAYGYHTAVHWLPEGADGAVLAVMELRGTARRVPVLDPEEEGLAGLYPAVLDRCTNRRRTDPTPLAPGVAAALARATEEQGGQLHLVSGVGPLEEMARILGASERVRFLVPRLRHEMLSELRWPGDDLTTGLDVRTLELPGAELALLGALRRDDVMAYLEEWDAGGGLGAPSAGAVRSSAAVAVVSVERPSMLDYLVGGTAFERLWVTAHQLGVAIQPVSPAFLCAVQNRDFDVVGGERHADVLRRLSAELRELSGLGRRTAIAVVLRLHYAPAPSVRSIRRPLLEVVEHLMVRRAA